MEKLPNLRPGRPRLENSFNNYCTSILLAVKNLSEAITQEETTEAYLVIIDRLQERELYHQQKRKVKG